MNNFIQHKFQIIYLDSVYTKKTIYLYLYISKIKKD